MKSALVLLVGLLLLGGISAAAFAELHTIPLTPLESQLQLREQVGDQLHYSVTVGELAVMDVTTDVGNFARMMIPGFHSSKVIGAPELPLMNRLIEIPYGATARIEVLSMTSRSIQLEDHGIANPLFPAQPSMPKNASPADWPFIYDHDAYAAQRVAQAPAQVVSLGRLRAADIGRLEVSPVEYYPAENRIVVHEEMEIRVTFEGTDHAAGDALKRRTQSPFFAPIYDRLDGLRTPHDDHPDLVRDVVTMIVVTPPEFEAQLGEYVEWKTQRGFHTILAVTGTPEVGATNASIQAYIHDLYNNPPAGIPAPSFVVFVGDVAQMPTWTVSGDASDRPYCDVEGDLVPDIYYGRLSATNSSQLEAILEKTLMYDQYTMPDPSYLGEVCMVSGMDSGFASVWGNGQINYGTTHYFNAAHGIYSHTYLYPESGSHASDIVQHVSDGVAFINYTAHGSQTAWGDPSFTQANINNLQNDGQYCTAIGNCCLTGSYNYGECFGETWLRAPNKGAIAYIGASNNTQWDEDYWFGVGAGTVVVNPTYEQTGLGAYDGAFHDHGEAYEQWYVVNAALIFSGNLAVMEGNGNYTYYWNIYNLSGDPSLSTYMGVPAANAVNHPTAIFTAWTSFDVEADENSYVGVVMDGILIGAGTVPASGTLELVMWDPPMSPGTLQITITAQNREPYVGSIEVMPPEGPFVIFEEYTCDDDNSGGSVGNGDGGADAGETIEIPVTLENVGVDPAENVVATIASDDPYIAILDGTESFGTIPPGEMRTSLDDFDIRIAGSCPDGHELSFTLTIEADGSRYVWDAGFSITVDAPVLSLYNVMVFDDDLGNGNGIAEAGETFAYLVWLENTGSEYATGVTVNLLSGHELVTIDGSGTSTTPAVPPGGISGLDPDFQITVSASSAPMEEYDLWLQVTADYGYAMNASHTLPVGGFQDDIEAGEGTWTHAVGGTGFIDQWHRTAYRNHTLGGGWSWKQGGADAGDYGNLCDGCLVTEEIPLADITRLRFHHWMAAETSSSYPDYCYDGGLVEMSLNGGAWQSVAPVEGYTHLIRTGGTPGPFPAETPVYSGAFDWTPALFELQSYAGTVQFRFRFGSDGASTEEGWYIDDVQVSGSGGSLADAKWESVVLRPELMLQQNAPNPFGSMTTIAFQLPRDQEISLQVFDTNGRVIRTLASGPHQMGGYRVNWNGTNDAGQPAPSGVYFYRLRSEEGVRSRALQLLR